MAAALTPQKQQQPQQQQPGSVAGSPGSRGRGGSPTSFALPDAEVDDDEHQPLVNARGPGGSAAGSRGTGGTQSASDKSPAKTHMHAGQRGGRVAALLKWGLLAALVGGVLFGLSKLMANPELIQAVLDGAKAHPGTVIPLYMLANFAAPLAVLPGGVFQVLAGAIWGIPLGFAITGPITFAAYVAAFALGRVALRRRLSEYMTANVPSFPAIQAAILAEGWSLVLMLRLSPVLPDALMNYALSLTSISLGVYAACTGAALVPWALFYLYIGSASSDIVATLSGGGSSGGSGGDDAGGAAWVNYAAGGASLLFGGVAVVYLSKVIKKAVDRAAHDRAATGTSHD